MSELEFDYVIIGSGSAGSALSYRLTENTAHTVLVLEYGGSDWGPLIQMPSALSYPMNMSRYDWGFMTEPEPHLDGRRLACPRGKVVGGSSSINGMVYVRGHAGDYDTWEDLGAKGWAYRHVLPYFMRLETSIGGEAGWRGSNGPLYVTRGEMRNPLYKAFLEAGQQAGYTMTADYNGRQGEGFGAMERTVHRGGRWSTAKAYLRPAMRTGRVKLLTHALADKIIFEGREARGVQFRQGGVLRYAKARKEVILSAGAINSPKILELSGIGDAKRLNSCGIPVVHDLASVGEGLQDHPEIHMQWSCKEPVSLNRHMNLLSKSLIGANWLFRRNGLGATNHFETCAFIRHKAGIRYPNLEIHFLPGAIQYDGKSVSKEHGFQVLLALSRPRSRGSVHIKSADPLEPASILFNYMSDATEWEEMRSGVRLVREIFSQPVIDRFRGPEMSPGESVQTDEAIDTYVRAKVESAYHPAGACRMGDPNDPTTVVDPECRVVGVNRLRVIDSSIIPLVTMGNINAPTILIGEKGADHVLGKHPLPAANNEPWYHPDWETKQR